MVSILCAQVILLEFFFDVAVYFLAFLFPSTMAIGVVAQRLEPVAIKDRHLGQLGFDDVADPLRTVPFGDSLELRRGSIIPERFFIEGFDDVSDRSMISKNPGTDR